ncbi:MAG: T9SS C-terminal target domain-containing protein [Ignavibacteriae bacterium]|nr:MAG: T9SS C-terminal target domain-containing protein [Ignavibacteriota bacterium]
MKRILLLIFIALTFTSFNLLFSQISWYSYNTGASGKINSLYFFSASTGFCTSEDGKILRTTNGGLNWSVQYTTSTHALKGITFVNSLFGFAGTMSNSSNSTILLRTVNGGNNWEQASTFSAGISLDKIVFFANELHGYTYNDNRYMGSAIYRTNSGGNNWNYVYGPVGGYYTSDIYFINLNTGWCIGGRYNIPYQGNIQKTTDGGVNWTYLGFIYQGINPYVLYKIYFYDENTGYMVNSYGSIRKTTSSGQTWTALDSNSAYQYKCIYFINSQTGYCGGNGIIRKTTNGGINWINNSVNGNIYNIRFADNNTGYAASDNGIIYKTTNGGITSTQKINENVPTKYSLYQNYPNPFNPETEIKFDITKAGNVSLMVYDVNGKRIAFLVDEDMNPGTYSVRWNAAGLSSGVYFYLLKTDYFTEMKKALLVK